VDQDQPGKANAEFHSLKRPVETPECEQAQQEVELENRQQRLALRQKDRNWTDRTKSLRPLFLGQRGYRRAVRRYWAVSS
jgi:hypothetical protein